MQAIIFDMDGLLIDSEPLWHEAEMTVFPTVGIHLTAEQCCETTGIRLDDVVKIRYNERPWTGKSLKQVEQEIVDELIALIREKLTIKPGVHEILAFFQAKKLPLAVASSSEFRIIHAALDKMNLSDAFSVIHSAEVEQYAKPHPAVYIHTAEKMKVQAIDCLAFEDSLPGVIAAKAARMKVVAVPEIARPQFAVADVKLASLLEFTEEVWMGLH